LILLFALGTTDGVWGISRNTLAQLLVDDALRGRVMSVVMLVTRGSSQVGQVQAGLLVGLIGPFATVLAGASIIALAIARSWRVRLTDAAEGQATRKADVAEKR
jgi:hypothetical protein